MNVADEIAKLADLKDRGALTSEEFDSAKAKVLANNKTIAEEGAPRKTNGLKVVALVVLALVLAFFALGFYLSNTPEGKEKAKSRAAIDLCWADYMASRLPLGSRALIADTCDMLAEQFKEKYGVAP